MQKLKIIMHDLKKHLGKAGGNPTDMPGCKGGNKGSKTFHFRFKDVLKTFPNVFKTSLKHEC